MLSQFNFAPKFGVKEGKREVVFNLKGKRCGNDALWKGEGRLDKGTLFHRDWKKGRNGENLLQFPNSPLFFPHSPQPPLMTQIAHI